MSYDSVKAFNELNDRARAVVSQVDTIEGDKLYDGLSNFNRRKYRAELRHHADELHGRLNALADRLVQSEEENE